MTKLENHTTNSKANGEAHQKQPYEGQTKFVKMNGCRVTMRYIGGRWWNVKVD